MAYFQNPEVSFEVPDDWVDQTAVVYVERIRRGIPASVTLVRNAISAADSLEARARDTVRRLTTQVPGTVVLEQNAINIGGTVPAVQLLLQCKHSLESVTQLITLFVRDGTFWALTATSPTARLETLDPIFEHVLGSLHVAKPQVVSDQLGPSGTEQHRRRE